MFQNQFALGFTITLIGLIIMCSEIWAAVQDIVGNVLPDKKTSILSLHYHDQHDLLEQVMQCCSQRFSVVRIDLDNPGNLSSFVMNYEKQVKGIKYFGPWTLFPVSVSLYVESGDKFRSEVEELVHNGGIHDINSIILKLPFLVGQPKYSLVIDMGVNTTLNIIRELKSSILSTTPSSRLMWGLEPLGYEESDGAYLIPHEYGTLMVDIFDFMIIPIPIHNLVFTYAQFQNEVDEQSKPVIRRIRLFKAKPELVLDLRFSLSKENISNPRARELCNQMMARFAYRYGAEHNIRVQFPLFQFHDGGNGTSPGVVEDEDEPIQKVLMLNHNLAKDDVSYPQLEPFLTVISRDFSTILIDSLDRYSNISNFLAKINKFNEIWRKSLTSPMSVIVRHQYLPAGKFRRSFAQGRQLLDELSSRFPGIVSGAILQFHINICYPGQVKDELIVALNETDSWAKRQTRVQPRNFPILGFGCGGGWSPNVGVISLMKILADDVNSLSLYVPSRGTGPALSGFIRPV